MTDKVLIIAFMENWVGISRMPAGLRRVGFNISVLCPEKSYLAKTIHVDSRTTFRTYTYSRSKIVYLFMLYSIMKYQPDLIIPGDEDALLGLQNLANILERIPYFNKYSKIIRKGLAPHEFDGYMLNKSRFVQKCAEWKVRVPRNEKVDSLQAALQIANEMGYPIVLKHDFGYGASGVTVCQNESELIKGFSKGNQKSFKQSLKHFIKNIFFVTPQEDKAGISIQQYISGKVGLVSFCAKNGNVFASNPMLKVMTYPGETGPSSVSKGINSDEARNFVNIVARNLNYNGFGSLDFIIDDKTQKLYVIELNPRPVPTTHFSSEFCSADLCEAYYRGLNNLTIPDRPYKDFLIALFPNEKKRDPKSYFLSTGYHDIPKDDPELVAALDS